MILPIKKVKEGASALAQLEKKQGRSNNNAKDKVHCMLHGPNPTHDTKILTLRIIQKSLKSKTPIKTNSKTQEEMNVVLNYAQKKMTDKRKRKDCKKSAYKKELNKFSNMSLKKKATMDMEDKEF